MFDIVGGFNVGKGRWREGKELGSGRGREGTGR